MFQSFILLIIPLILTIERVVPESTWTPPKFKKDVVEYYKIQNLEDRQIDVEIHSFCEHESEEDDVSTRNGPNFIIIGAPKAGTTYLSILLGKHEGVGFAPVLVDKTGVEFWKPNELNFFGSYGRSYKEDPESLKWYRSLFTCASRIYGDSTLLFEKSVNYLCDPKVPHYVHNHFPHTKLIIMLRNPIDRLYSHIIHDFKKGEAGWFDCSIDTLGLEHCTERMALELLKNESEKTCTSPKKKKKKASRRMSVLCTHLKKGVYLDQIMRWREYFPKDQILVIKSEDLFTNSREVFDRTLEFLGASLEYGESVTFDHVKLGYQEMSPELRENLKEFYDPHNLALYEYLGRSFGWD